MMEILFFIIGVGAGAYAERWKNSMENRLNTSVKQCAELQKRLDEKHQKGA